ncbi:hypothetical protein CPB85DRAFT_1211936 [Mucidula mucida]|nr:hypothetical protein CPB85DRAFT_1211936 [Mucidula mucida]
MSPSAPAPSAQEIQRKLSVHSAVNSPRPPVASISGTESDSDSILSPDVTPSGMVGAGGHGGAMTQPPLSSIAEARSNSGGEDTDDDEDEEEGGWKTAARHNSVDESVIKAGYLWKKGERRKTWKKRWFVLRPTQLAYYKTNAEYQLLRLLDLSDIHSCTQVSLKKHDNTFGLVSPVRTFYLQAKTPNEVREWISAIDETRQMLMSTSTQSSVSNPIPIPRMQDRSGSLPPPPVTPSPPHMQNATSSDSEDASPGGYRSYSTSSQHRTMVGSSPSKSPSAVAKDPTKSVLSGYLMKCGSKRRNWRKRWFVLSGERLVYYTSHMDAKPHRQFALGEILDALEYDLQAHRQNLPLTTSPPLPGSLDGDDPHSDHAFKIVTTKRTLLLCAPNEEDEIKWLGAIRALIARRSGAGVVPGEPTKVPTTSTDVSPNSSGFASGGSALKGKVRRLSTSGSTFGGGAIQEENTERK